MPEAPLRVGLTGATGLVGWPLRCRLVHEAGHDVTVAERATFASPEALAAFVADRDVIVHLAAMNRGPEDEVEAVNVALADALVDALDSAGAKPALVFASSTHVERDTAYGRAKRTAAQRLGAWADRRGAPLTTLVLPHVFGEGGRPFHNSVVATFCHQLARGETPTIDSDGDLELLHAQEVADLVLEAIATRCCGTQRPTGRRLRVSELLDRLRALADRYEAGVIPAFETAFDLRLFNTYRAHRFAKRPADALELRSDDRGTLFEAVKTAHGGQAFLSRTVPGATRGNHFHFEKFERFLVLEGQASIRIRRLFDDRITELAVRGETPTVVDMPTLHTHAITNTGDGPLVTLFWAHEIFDPARPDTVAVPVDAPCPRSG